MWRINKKLLLVTPPILLMLWYWQSAGNQYDQLEALLAAKRWQEADQLTTNIILKDSNWRVSTLRMWLTGLVSGELAGWYEPIKQYPCDKLRTLDNLWTTYSDRRFGLSVQQKIFTRNAAQSRDEFKTYDSFIKEVAWSDPEDVVGHFPSKEWVQATTYGKGEPWMLSAVYMYDRVEQCQQSYN